MKWTQTSDNYDFLGVEISDCGRWKVSWVRGKDIAYTICNKINDAWTYMDIFKSKEEAKSFAEKQTKLSTEDVSVQSGCNDCKCSEDTPSGCPILEKLSL